MTIQPGLASSNLTEREFDLRSPDIEIKWWNNNDCRTSYGGNRKYKSGECVNLDDHRLGDRIQAVSIQARKKKWCHVIRYEGLNCKGNSEVTVGMGDCAEVAGKWDSVEFTCEHFCL
ncbi:hypothetical protein CC79DRAFT_1364036 [Sarocladium strictum]